MKFGLVILLILATAFITGCSGEPTFITETIHRRHGEVIYSSLSPRRGEIFFAAVEDTTLAKKEVLVYGIAIDGQFLPPGTLRLGDALWNVYVSNYGRHTLTADIYSVGAGESTKYYEGTIHEPFDVNLRERHPNASVGHWWRVELVWKGGKKR